MGLHQTFLFKAKSDVQVLEWLRNFAGVANIEERPGFFVFEQLAGQPVFEFDCELIEGGFRSNRAGEYFGFLGMFVEGLTGEFGAVVIEDY